jgi:hypothetical protein
MKNDLLISWGPTKSFRLCGALLFVQGSVLSAIEGLKYTPFRKQASMSAYRQVDLPYECVDRLKYFVYTFFKRRFNKRASQKLFYP